MKKRVVVIDDEPFILKMIAVRLKSNGYEVFTAGNGEKGLALIREIQPDAVLLDLVMPGLSGFDVCQKLKNSEDIKHIPVIMLTALAQKQDISRGIECGAKFFVTKPYDPEDLLYKLKKALE